MLVNERQIPYSISQSVAVYPVSEENKNVDLDSIGAPLRPTVVETFPLPSESPANQCLQQKVSATSFDAFASPNHPPLATVSATGSTVSWPLIQRPPPQKFTIRPTLSTSHVACLRIFPGIRT
jgi:hypothetical protein